MKKAILNALRGLFFYYSSGGTAGIPYFSTICVLTLAIIIHFVQFTLALYRFAHIDVPFFAMPEGIHKGYKYLLMAVYLAPIFFILTRIFPERKIKFKRHELEELRSYRYYFFVYLAVNVLIIVLLVADRMVIRK
ncbi:hypothetical protein EV199_1020 [Pseudobacter ginsenosidimutans]|uniref:Uncharacterized protein n=1 Tax=Pseudobacter ginsenosidimutans TaxID=661488 RepID=A0A4Q7N2M2_9BACT|nr:hypothetical protein EV199_1020 [Pseudobacter ginsenosidimutans]